MLSEIETLSATTIGQRWRSVDGVHYQPMVSGDLTAWAPLGGAVVGTGEMIVMSMDVGSAFSSGGVRRRKWVGDVGIDALRILARTGGTAADVEDRLVELRVGQSDPDENDYVQCITGYLVPPTSGVYTFWIAGDDASEFWLSPDLGTASVVRVAWISSYSNQNQWTKSATQKSAPIALVAGRAYYFEIFQREGGGGDHVAVAWTKPGDAVDTREIIAGPALSSTGENLASLLADGRVFFGLEVSDADRDGDGLTDYEEAVLGLDAGDATTKPRVDDLGSARARVTSPSVLTVGVAAGRAYEGDGAGGAGSAARFQIFRSGGIKPLVVNYALSGTATKAVDYPDPGRSAQIPVASGSATVGIAALPDDEVELPEGVTMTLLPGVGYTLAACRG